jgi:hypothetical protein
MEKQTAVDYIFHTFYNEDNISDYVLRIFEQAKEMEKEQIMDFANEYGTYLLQGGTMTAGTYNETFKSE